MNQSRCRQSMIRTLAANVRAGQPLKLAINYFNFMADGAWADGWAGWKGAQTNSQSSQRKERNRNPTRKQQGINREAIGDAGSKYSIAFVYLIAAKNATLTTQVRAIFCAFFVLIPRSAFAKPEHSPPFLQHHLHRRLAQWKQGQVRVLYISYLTRFLKPRLNRRAITGNQNSFIDGLLEAFMA